ncbi:gibberellin-regulated protein 14-like isoform X2 [Mangifera indica]|uniref:gibberellin-regulated protein 14-like isoform X2 n=1 Tax=Mangifera indica TaxID=29780 RepID=UPI001CFB3D81|nr:gibberellin-regulated protein 14-like isoform X2 [Mangifera indica]
MTFRPQLLLLATFLLVSTTVSATANNEEELLFGKATAPPLVKAPTATPPPPVSPPKATPPPPPPVNPPQTTPPPPVSPPKITPPPPVSPPKPTPPTVSPPLPPVRSKKDCLPICGGRCKLHSRKNLCVRACVTCCDRCKCVPPGTYGNRELCGKCYTDMTTRNNKPKCP